MIVHYKKYDPEKKQWLIKCLDKMKYFPLDGDWNDNHYCPFCMEKLPALKDMRYFKN